MKSEFVSFYQRDKSLFQKFWEKVLLDDDDKCWNWNASKNKKGYGNFYVSIGHSKDKHCLAHRMSYMFRHGEIPNNLQVLHICDNPSCVNPLHLFLGTNDDNVRDKISKGRQYNVRGEDHPNSRLTENDVREIRKLRTENGLTYIQLAELYKIDPSTAGYIVKRKLWNHVN